MITLLLAILTAVLPACDTEDAANCYWDAGNTGTSFVDLNGTAYYIER